MIGVYYYYNRRLPLRHVPNGRILTYRMSYSECMSTIYLGYIISYNWYAEYFTYLENVEMRFTTDIISLVYVQSGLSPILKFR